MGSIASVLQWHCSDCSLINPTEALKCARCSLSRIKSDEKAASTYLLLNNSLTQCPSTPGIENNSYSSSGSSSPPTPPPRHFSSVTDGIKRVSVSPIKLPKEPIKLPPRTKLHRNQYGLFFLVR